MSNLLQIYCFWVIGVWTPNKAIPDWWNPLIRWLQKAVHFTKKLPLNWLYCIGFRNKPSMDDITHTLCPVIIFSPSPTLPPPTLALKALFPLSSLVRFTKIQVIQVSVSIQSWTATAYVVEANNNNEGHPPFFSAWLLVLRIDGGEEEYSCFFCCCNDIQPIDRPKIERFGLA